MLNVITIQGRLTRDPELRHTTNGTAVASFALAVDRDYTSKDGGERETDFVDIVAWRGTAEFVSKYFTKGQLAIVSGRLQIRPWTDDNGNKRRSTEVVAEHVYFGGSKKETGSAAPQAAAQDGTAPALEELPECDDDGAKSALCPTNPVSTSLYITGDGATGEVVAVEMVPNVPGQQDMFGEEQEAAPILKMVRNA